LNSECDLTQIDHALSTHELLIIYSYVATDATNINWVLAFRKILSIPGRLTFRADPGVIACPEEKLQFLTTELTRKDCQRIDVVVVVVFRTGRFIPPSIF
jgi:hypothetical protein